MTDGSTGGSSDAHRPGRLEGVRLLFVANVDWFFISHRLPLLRAAMAEGAVVAVAAADTDRLREIETMGAETYALPLSRSGTGVVEQVRALVAIGRVIRRFGPDVVHNVTIKPVLFGTLLTRALTRRARLINAISGFGYAVDGGDRRWLRRVVIVAYRILFRSRRVVVVVQNQGAVEVMLRDRLARADQVELVEGSGVDCDVFTPRTGDRGDEERVRVVMASRILRDKGVFEFCRATALLDSDRVDAVLAGSLDAEGNPTALARDELDELCRETGVRYLGEVDDMSALLRDADVAVLPSYHEGLPKVLLEAAASGLPLIATDIPGCRPVVHPGVNGELVPVRSVDELAAAIGRLVDDGDLRRRYGARSRRLAVERFSVDRVAGRFVDLYERGAARP